MLQDVVTVSLNHKNIVKDPQRITKIKPFLDKPFLERNRYQTIKIGKV